MIFGIITLVIALSISITAAYFSIAGLAALFAAAVIPIIIMGSALEAGKLVAAVWLHSYWKTAPRLLKGYLTGAVIMLMAITSMGIYGFLSKGHIQQNAPLDQKQVQIEYINERINSLETKIEREKARLEQLDSIIKTLVEYDKISGDDGARAVRQRQADERGNINESIESSYNKIDELTEKRANLKENVADAEAKLGPVKYVSELIFDNPQNNMDRAVRYVILMIIFAFDPLAVLLLLAANHTFMQHNKNIFENAAQNVQNVEEQPAHSVSSPKEQSAQNKGASGTQVNTKRKDKGLTSW